MNIHQKQGVLNYQRLFNWLLVILDNDNNNEVTYCIIIIFIIIVHWSEVVKGFQNEMVPV